MIGYGEIANMSNLNKSTTDAAIAAITLDKASGQPLHVQLTGQLRGLILSGRILPGERLPASRSLANELGVSRITVTTSMDQLVAEGYAEGRRGQGLFVVPDSAGQRPEKRKRRKPGTRLEAAATAQVWSVVPFQPAALDDRLFPHEEWAKLLERCWREQGPTGSVHFQRQASDPCARLLPGTSIEWRGLACQPSDVDGDGRWCRCGAAARRGARSCMAARWCWKTLATDCSTPCCRPPMSEVLPQPVDSHGLDPLTLPHASLAIVTPSRHYPLGFSMPLARRLDLIEWADRHEAFIVEDDFDSEYRYRGTPLPAMMGLRDTGRVIYLGSFSKVFSPALRLGYLVLPPAVTPKVMQVLEARGAMASAVAQPALARFMASGRFATHIRRMRRTYATRQQALVEAVGTHLAGLLEVEPEAGGMHLTARLSRRLAQA
jgi:GntR family transcriptional regulator/MocR family aminotransferase